MTADPNDALDVFDGSDVRFNVGSLEGTPFLIVHSETPSSPTWATFCVTADLTDLRYRMMMAFTEGKQQDAFVVYNGRAGMASPILATEPDQKEIAWFQENAAKAGSWILVLEWGTQANPFSRVWHMTLDPETTHLVLGETEDGIIPKWLIPLEGIYAGADSTDEKETN